MEVNGQHHAPAALPPGKNPRIQLIGDVVGPRAGHGGFGEEEKKSCSYRDSTKWKSWIATSMPV